MSLRLWEAVGISLALMAPSMAANINPQGTAATTVGRAVSLAFALATIGVLLIAWTFVRLTQRFTMPAACTVSSAQRSARGLGRRRGPNYVRPVRRDAAGRREADG